MLHSLRTRIWLATTALVALSLLLSAALVLRLETRELRESLVRESRTFVRLAGPWLLRAYGASVRGDTSDAQLLARARELARALPALEAFSVIGPAGRRLLVYPADTELGPLPADLQPQAGYVRFQPVPGGDRLELIERVRGPSGAPEVLVQMRVSDAPIRARLASLRTAYWGSLAVLLAVATLLASWMARSLQVPLASLKQAAARIGQGPAGERVPEAGPSEVVDLARALNRMVRDLEQQRATLRQRNQELERAYRELQALQQELVTAERLASVGRVAAGVSHEIDNPIGVILGTAQMLRDQLPTDPRLKNWQEDLEIIEAECRRCRRIVRDMLDLARPGSAEGGHVEVAPTLRGLLRGLQHHPDFRQVTVTLQLDSALPAVRIDGDRLKQVFLNLFLNAAQAMGGDGRLKITGELDDESGQVVIEVLDSGPGVAPGSLPNIFEPFFSTGPGTGLGLAVTRRILEECGGGILAENRPAGGTRFEVRLPTPAPQGDADVRA